jgi:hypothetical protein
VTHKQKQQNQAEKSRIKTGQALNDPKFTLRRTNNLGDAQPFAAEMSKTLTFFGTGRMDRHTSAPIRLRVWQQK